MKEVAVVLFLLVLVLPIFFVFGASVFIMQIIEEIRKDQRRGN